AQPHAPRQRELPLRLPTFLEGFRDALPLRLLHLLRHARKRPPRAATSAIPHGTSLAGRLLIGGDWNEPASTKGKWSPGWIAQQAGMTTHGGVESHGHGKIDYAMSYGCRVSNVKAGPTGGSDHNIVTFTVSRPKGQKG
ncbi:hypothetical protein, partial [Corallococcus exercitus]